MLEAELDTPLDYKKNDAKSKTSKATKKKAFPQATKRC
jgi:hypothetical protein